FTATVSPTTPLPTGAAGPTGTVTFTISGNGPALTAPVDPATRQASVSVSTLTAGTHTITATYSGDTNFTGSTTSTTQTVDKAATSTTVTTTPSPSVYGQAVTVTATVTPTAPLPTGAAGPTGTVTFTISDDGPALTAPVDPATGQAAVSLDTLSVGSHSVTAAYSGDANFTLSTAAGVTETVGKAATDTTLTALPNPSTYGQSVTFTATVSPTTPLPTGAAGPTGTVTFTIDGTPNTVALIGNQATYTIGGLTVGNHTVVATYDGDTNFTGSTSTTLTQVVEKINTTMTAVPGSIVRVGGGYRIPVLTGVLVNTSTRAGIPGKSVTFTVTVAGVTTILGSAITTTGGAATLTNVPVPPNLRSARSYTATFAGDALYTAASATAPLTFTG
ncbi:Ig-like domain repeat protein, partial [Amycolatopsis rhizosphaerae]